MKLQINREKFVTQLPKWLVAFARTVLIIGMAYVFLFPVLYLVSMSIRDAATVSDPSIVWVPKVLSLESIQKAWDVMNYSQTALLSLLIAITSTAAACISCSLVGYGLSRFKFAEKNLLFFVVILMIIVPPYTVLIPSYMNFRFFDLLGFLRLFTSETFPGYINLTDTTAWSWLPFASNSVFTFILPSMFATGLRAGLFIFIFRQNFLGMPKDLEEAACIDGCSPMGTFIRVIAPLAKSSFITVILFSFVWHWNEYSTSAIYFLGDIKPVAVMLNSLKNSLFQSNPEFIVLSHDLMRTYLAAGALLVVIPPLLLYIFAQRHFTESIERTGIVG